MCSDHLAPWTPSQGESGFAWAWLGAALQATERMSFGLVNAPGQRYHPAIVAQALATLGEMYPRRVWAALGSGEALNEHVTGEPWPPKPERNERLRESADSIRALLAGRVVTHRGRVTLDRARVWSLPRDPLPLFGAAVSEATARWLGSWADGLITVTKPEPELRRVVRAFREGGGEGKPMLLQAQISWAENERAAREAALREWPIAGIDTDRLWDLATPEAIAAEADKLREADVRGEVDVVTDAAGLEERLRRWERLGFEAVYLHNVVRDRQREFVAEVGRELFPWRTRR